MVRRLLILGGTTEAAALARRAVELPGLDVVTSLAGRTRAPAALPGRVRIGGFGGAEGLAGWLDAEGIDAVIDATHPFAATISAHAARACALRRTPRLMLVRPAWEPRPGEAWTEIPDGTAAAAALPAGAHAFLTVGRQELAVFAARRDVRFLVRVIDPPAMPVLPG